MRRFQTLKRRDELRDRLSRLRYGALHLTVTVRPTHPWRARCGADSFIQVDETPLLGTGELDLKALKDLALKHFRDRDAA